MKKTTKAKLLVVCMLLLTLCLTGCGLLKSDTQKLKELLEAKYGEEFGVESYYYAGDMWAMCYPVSDPTLLFEVRTDGKISHIVHDYYLQNLVARQLEGEYELLAQQAFPGCFLSVGISNTLSSVPDNFPKANAVTLDDITQYCDSMGQSSYIVMNIFVDVSQMSDKSVEAEYEFLRDTIGNKVANDELPDVIVKLYFGDAVFVQECENVIAEETWSESGIYKMTESSPQIWIGYYDNGEIDYTLEVYIEKRTEALSNE